MANYTRRTFQKQLLKDQVPEFKLHNPQVSVENSVEFLKKLTVIAVSSITYLRDVFPSESFSEKQLDGHIVRILKGNDDVPGTVTLISWIKHAFELVNSQHLKKMILVIQKQDTTLEIYTFSYTYNHEEVQCNVYTEVDGKEVLLDQRTGLPEDIAKSVRQLLRSLLTLTTTLPPLPNNCELFMKLYLDESTPDEVIPVDYFKVCSSEAINFSGDTYSQNLGKVESKFTTFALSIKSAVNEDNNEEDHNNEEDVVSEDDIEGAIIPSSQSEPEPSSMFSLNKSQSNRKTSTRAEHEPSPTKLSERLSIVSLNEKTISCICQCEDQFDNIVQCVSCSTFQHKACYKLLNYNQANTHICVKCHDPEQGKICSVPDLLGKSDATIKKEALYRQALMLCCNTSQVSCKKLMTQLKVSRRMAEQIFHQLDMDECFEPASSKSTVRHIKSVHLKEDVLSRYFNASSDSTHMDIEYPSTAERKNMLGNKKKLDVEEKKNLSGPVLSSPQQKRRKFMVSSTTVKSSSWNRL